MLASGGNVGLRYPQLQQHQMGYNHRAKAQASEGLPRMRFQLLRSVTQVSINSLRVLTLKQAPAWNLRTHTVHSLRPVPSNRPGEELNALKGGRYFEAPGGLLKLSGLWPQEEPPER